MRGWGVGRRGVLRGMEWTGLDWIGLGRNFVTVAAVVAAAAVAVTVAVTAAMMDGGIGGQGRGTMRMGMRNTTEGEMLHRRTAQVGERYSFGRGGWDWRRSEAREMEMETETRRKDSARFSSREHPRARSISRSRLYPPSVPPSSRFQETEAGNAARASGCLAGRGIFLIQRAGFGD
jgi:hypothetical protein